MLFSFYRSTRTILPVIKVFLAIAFSILCFPATTSAQTFLEIVEELKATLKNTDDPQNKVDLLNDISYAYRRIEPDSTAHYALRAIEQAEKQNYLKGIGEGRKNLGLAYVKKSLPIDTVMSEFEIALEIGKQINSPYLIAAAYGNMGVTYLTVEQIGKARIALQNGLVQTEKTFEGSESAKALLLSALAYTYFIGDDSETAIKYFEESMSLARKYDDRATLSIWLDTYGKILYKYGDIEKGLALIEEATQYYISLGDTEVYMQNSLTLSEMDIAVGKLVSAEKRAEDILQFARDRKDLKFECLALYRLAQVSHALKDHNKASNYGEQIIKIIDVDATVYQPEEMMEFLQKMYVEMGDTEKVLALADRRIEWLKNSFDEEMGREATRLQEEYFDRRIEHEKEVLEETQKNFTRWMTILLILLLITLASLAQLYQSKKMQIAQNQKLRLAKLKLEEASEVRSKFLSVMSHEIRTPISAILGFADILLEKEKEKEKSKYLKYLRLAGKHLESLINDILDYAKINARKLSLEHTPLHLNELLEDLVETMRVTNNNDKVKLILEEEVPQNTILIGDSHRLKQILFNLLSNAIKFTNKGYVKLQAKQLSVANNETQIKFQVEDTGIGIAAEKQEIIFDSFEQANVSTTREYGGTGLGLAITKQLVEAHAGQLSLESELGKGSIFSFTITLPLFKEEKITASQELAEFNCPQQLDGKRILLVEDNLFNQKIVTKALSDWGVKYQIAQNGMEAIAAVEQQNFDAILMDINMPVMDGLDATRHIRSYDNEKCHLPIIAITANAFQENIEQAQKAGMNGFITKPFSKKQIYEKLTEVLMKN
ncbi:MAG: ATP-binding protein [Bacteroidota bacterium]